MYIRRTIGKPLTAAIGFAMASVGISLLVTAGRGPFTVAIISTILGVGVMILGVIVDDD